MRGGLNLADVACRRLYPHIHEAFTSKILANTGGLVMSFSKYTHFAKDSQVIQALRPAVLDLKAIRGWDHLWADIDVRRVRSIYLELHGFPSRDALALLSRCSATLKKLDIVLQFGPPQMTHEQLLALNLPKFAQLEDFSVLDVSAQPTWRLHADTMDATVKLSRFSPLQTLAAISSHCFSGCEHIHKILINCAETLTAASVHQWLSEYAELAPRLERLSALHLDQQSGHPVLPVPVRVLETHLAQRTTLGLLDDGTLLINWLEQDSWAPALAELKITIATEQAQVLRQRSMALQNSPIARLDVLCRARSIRLIYRGLYDQLYDTECDAALNHIVQS